MLYIPTDPTFNSDLFTAEYTQVEDVSNAKLVYVLVFIIFVCIFYFVLPVPFVVIFLN